MKVFLLFLVTISIHSFAETEVDFEIRPQWLGIPWKDTAPLEIGPSTQVKLAGKIKKLEWARKVGMQWEKVAETSDFKSNLNFLDAKAKDSVLHTVTFRNLNAYLFTPMTHSFRVMAEAMNGFKETLEFHIPVVVGSKFKMDPNDIDVKYLSVEVPEKDRQLVIESAGPWLKALGLRDADRVVAYEIRNPGDGWNLHHKLTPDDLVDQVTDTQEHTIFKFVVIRENKKLTLLAYQGKEPEPKK